MQSIAVTAVSTSIHLLIAYLLKLAVQRESPITASCATRISPRAAISTHT
ncbi:unnamed protein product [Hymenolepis diminuta]|uniref:Uncharacterized protein n=1 Tax=Hymenolepis diminuta TaxID=6216 RepID=A0A564Y2D4_HYMDI|nr:unnamed protein product [Hymenolepis diminuta]